MYIGDDFPIPEAGTLVGGLDHLEKGTLIHSHLSGSNTYYLFSTSTGQNSLPTMDKLWLLPSIHRGYPNQIIHDPIPRDVTTLGISNETPSQGLCPQCQTLLELYPESKSGHWAGSHKLIFATKGLLEDTAISGCSLCQLFLDSIPARDRNVLRENESFYARQYVRTIGHFPGNGESPSLDLKHLDIRTQTWVDIEATVQMIPKIRKVFSAIGAYLSTPRCCSLIPSTRYLFGSFQSKLFGLHYWL